MADRIVVPVLEEAGESSKLSPHFGRAPYFAIAEIGETGQIQYLEFQPNRSSHFGGQVRPPDLLLGFKPSIIVSPGMGPRALHRFQVEGVAVMKAMGDTLGEVLGALSRDELPELTEGCHHAKHK